MRSPTVSANYSFSCPAGFPP